MKPSVLKTTLLALVTMGVLAGCVRLKDKDKDEDKQAPVSLKTYEMRNLTIDEPLYLVNGDLVRRADLAQVKEKNWELPLGSQTEYELHFEHLNFKEGGVLFTMGQTVRIYVDDLDSRGGKIISWPEDAVAPLMAEGFSGGSVYLQVQHARGELSLFMVGGQGGQGIQGATGADGIASNGAELRFSKDKGGQLYCPFGFRGGVGSQGARGGPSGTADVVLYDDNNFDLHVNRQGGRGGNGGAGGDGGRSGPPGGYCRDVYKEPRGAVGPSGPQGESGLIQDICVTRGSGKRQCI